MWFGRRLLRSLGESVIWNSPSITAFYGNSGTEFWGCRADCVPEFLPRAMRIAPRELLESFHDPLGATPLRFAGRTVDSRSVGPSQTLVVASLCEAWRCCPQGDGNPGQWRYELNGRGR